jgi:hypothetical protein
MAKTQKSVTLGPELEAGLADLNAKIDASPDCPRWIRSLGQTERLRLVLSLGMEAMEREHRLR